MIIESLIFFGLVITAIILAKKYIRQNLAVYGKDLNLLQQIQCGQLLATEKTFHSSKYNITAKVDYLYKYHRNEVVLLEYKSRLKGIHKGDIQQLKASAVAVKETHDNLRFGLVYNQSGEFLKVDLKSSDRLISDISKEIEWARLIKSGEKPNCSRPANQCSRCGFKDNCELYN
ncbi:MAG: Dna2/Cas4 domain-containing protein [Methylococcales bacterium]|jgi:CRISPR/Cas system-associated exonuclease Cas4 (RecB family)|nr:Dna2/Cas4 domain-containing protein [Methylococcales bacterium]